MTRDAPLLLDWRLFPYCSLRTIHQWRRQTIRSRGTEEYNVPPEGQNKTKDMGSARGVMVTLNARICKHWAQGYTVGLLVGSRATLQWGSWARPPENLGYLYDCNHWKTFTYFQMKMNARKADKDRNYKLTNFCKPYLHERSNNWGGRGRVELGGIISRFYTCS